MMMSLPENYINRIDIPVDWSKCTKEEAEILEGYVDLGNLQLNAQCNNRLARITELERELSAIDDPIRGDEIKNEIQLLQFSVEDDKRRGVFQDYGLLKRRIAEGDSAEDVHTLMPHFYAIAQDDARRINSRPAKLEKPFLALIGGTTLIGVLANLITIRDSGLANRLRELLQEILRM